MTILWLDDIRNPLSGLWGDYILKSLNWTWFPKGTRIVWTRTFEGFKDVVESKFPDIIFFDHDLGHEETGKDCANWLIEYCMDNNKKLPRCFSQSSNPVGKENIMSILNQFQVYQSKG